MTGLLILSLLFSNNIVSGELKKKMSDKPNRIRSFLNNISQIESSGGKNFNHKPVQTGIQAGTTAIGRYGLMPNTVNEVLNRLRMNGQITPELNQLRNLDPVTLKSTLEKNPNLEDQIAQSLAGKVLDTQQDEDKAAYSWHKGHNLTPEQVDSRDYQDNDYVKKYDEYKKLTNEDENE